MPQSKNLRPITKAQTQWASRECIEHYAYRLPKGKTTCMDCGHSWQMNETTEHCTCPQCGVGLQVKETYQRKLQQKQYFTILTTSGGYQVLRMYLLIVGMEKGYRAVSSVIEIGQYWWSESGRQAIVAVQRIMGHYVDSFAYYSPMAIRNENEAYRFIAHCPLYPKTEAKDLNKYWQAYKITLRRGYDITDIALWCDYVDMLGRLGKDTHNAHFICPEDLQAAHDTIQRKLQAQRDKEAEARRRQRAIENEERFQALKAPFNTTHLCVHKTHKIKSTHNIVLLPTNINIPFSSFINKFY